MDKKDTIVIEFTRLTEGVEKGSNKCGRVKMKECIVTVNDEVVWHIKTVPVKNSPFDTFQPVRDYISWLIEDNWSCGEPPRNKGKKFSWLQKYF